MTVAPQMRNISAQCQAFLQQYAAGSLDEAQSLAMACYLTLNPDKIDALLFDESVGGALFERADENLPFMSRGSLENTLNRLEQGEHSGKGSVAYEDTLTHADYASYIDDMQLPRALGRYLPDPEKRKWKALMPGIKTISLRLPVRESGGLARLLKMAPGKRVPPHAHRGTEMTLVFKGSFSDAGAQYRAGEMAIETSYDDQDDHAHAPRAHWEEGCVCLIVTTAPPRFRGAFSLLNPFLR